MNSSSKTRLPEEVLQAYNSGKSVIPIGLDKKPKLTSWREFQERRPTLQELQDWGRTNPAAWAQVCGRISEVITLDFDGEAGKQTLDVLGLQPHRRTGSGGYHVDVQWPGARVPTLNGKTKADLARRWPGLDVRGDGGYAIILGRNQSGVYQWLRDAAPDPVEVLPEDLLTYLTSPKGGSSPSAASQKGEELECSLEQAVEDAKRIGRNSAGFDLARAARDQGLSRDEAVQLLHRFRDRVGNRNLKGLIEEYTEDELRSSVEQAFSRAPRRSPMASTSSHPRTDAGNAELLARLYAGQLKFDHKRGQWLIWKQHSWRVDALQECLQLAKRAARVRLQEASTGNAHDHVDEAKWALKSEDMPRLQAALRLVVCSR